MAIHGPSQSTDDQRPANQSNHNRVHTLHGEGETPPSQVPPKDVSTTSTQHNTGAVGRTGPSPGNTTVDVHQSERAKAGHLRPETTAWRPPQRKKSGGIRALRRNSSLGRRSCGARGTAAPEDIEGTRATAGVTYIDSAPAERGRAGASSVESGWQGSRIRGASLQQKPEEWARAKARAERVRRSSGIDPTKRAGIAKRGPCERGRPTGPAR